MKECIECKPGSFQESPFESIFCLDCGKTIGKVDKMLEELIDFQTSFILGKFYSGLNFNLRMGFKK